MASGRLVWLALALVMSCQNDYPLEPTACDRRCRAVRTVSCFELDPAECVATCEEGARQQGSAERTERCLPLFEAMTECYSTTPGAAEYQLCGTPLFDPIFNPSPCEQSELAWSYCLLFEPPATAD